MTLVERTAVVTGAGRGIGKALAARLVQEGLQVVINDLRPEELEATAAEIGAKAVPGDAASDEGIAKVIKEAKAHFGGEIDIWFANAGIDRGQGLDASDADWEASINVNVMAHVRAARQLVPGWLERGRGRFVVTASAAGLLTMLGSPTYSVTKHGAVAFAEWLSAMYRHRGLVVQAICPQGVRTNMLPPSGPITEILSRDSALETTDVAETVWQALQTEKFLILPHPEVAGYYQGRATDTDRWLTGMNKLQQRIDAVLSEGHA